MRRARSYSRAAQERARCPKGQRGRLLRGMFLKEEQGGVFRVFRGRLLPLVPGDHRFGVKDGRPLAGGVFPLLSHQFLEKQDTAFPVPRAEESDGPLQAKFPILVRRAVPLHLKIFPHQRGGRGERRAFPGADPLVEFFPGEGPEHCRQFLCGLLPDRGRLRLVPRPTPGRTFRAGSGRGRAPLFPARPAGATPPSPFREPPRSRPTGIAGPRRRALPPPARPRRVSPRPPRGRRGGPSRRTSRRSRGGMRPAVPGATPSTRGPKGKRPPVRRATGSRRGTRDRKGVGTIPGAPRRRPRTGTGPRPACTWRRRKRPGSRHPRPRGTVRSPPRCPRPGAPRARGGLRSRRRAERRGTSRGTPVRRTRRPGLSRPAPGSLAGRVPPPASPRKPLPREEREDARDQLLLLLVGIRPG